MIYTLRSFLIVILFTTLLIYGSNVTASNFFIECDKALEKKEFLPLKKYYDKHPDEPHPDMCFRLNNNEFLVTVTSTGRVFQGLYYFNSKEEKLGRGEGGGPNIEVKEEFLGKNNKRYVLLSWSNLSHGDWDYGFDILNLIPKREGKPFIVYNLLYVNEDPVSGLCGAWSSKDKSGKIERHQNFKEGKKESIKGYKIIDQGTENVRIVFTITEQDCKTLEERTYQKTFHLVDGAFKLAK
jgi:hypothetical protein